MVHMQIHKCKKQQHNTKQNKTQAHYQSTNKISSSYGDEILNLKDFFCYLLLTLMSFQISLPFYSMENKVIKSIKKQNIIF